MPCRQQLQSMQQERQCRIDELLSVLQRPNVTPAQVDAAHPELARLFNSTAPANIPTPERLQVLVSLMSHRAPSVAAAAASILNTLSKSESHSEKTIRFLQQAPAQSAVVQLLTGHGTAAHAALQLLLTLVGQSVNVHFQTSVRTGIQHAMLHPSILYGLVSHVARGPESTTAAAVVLLARWTISSSSADNPFHKGLQLAHLFNKHCTALKSVASLLLYCGSHVCLADAAAQLLYTIAQAGPQAAGMLAASKTVMARLAELMMTSSKQPPTATPDVQIQTTAAAWRAARALSAIFEKVDTQVRSQLVTKASVIAQMVQAVGQAGDAALQDRAVHVLLAAVSNKEQSVCRNVIAQPAFAASLLPLLPGGTRTVQVAQELAEALAASSTNADCTRFFKDLVAALVDMQRQADTSASLQQPDAAAAAAAAAAEQAVWVLTKLPPACSDICQQLKAVVPLLVSTASCGTVEGKFRDSLASRLAALVAWSMLQRGSSTSAWPQAAGIALVLMVDAASTEVRTSLAAADGVISSLAHCVEKKGHAVCDSASRALTQLAAASKTQLGPANATAAADSSKTSMHAWLLANSSTLQEMNTSGWGGLTVTQLAAAAEMAAQSSMQVYHLESAPVPAPAPPPCASPPPPPPPASSPPRSIPPPPPAAAAAVVLQQPRQAAVAAAHKPTTDTRRCRTDQGDAIAAAARMLAGQAAARSQPKSSVFNVLDPATQKLIQEECGAIPPDQQLPAWKVAVQPFDSQQLQALCATYMRCNFAGVSWDPEVRSQELVPLLQQLHTQAKAEQLAAPQAASSSAAAEVMPTPASLKLLRVLRMLQHWDIVCPTQPGMPEPLRKMMRRAGCTAGEVGDGDDDVQVLDSGPAAEVDDDVDAQLQQLEDGECELVLVKYVPGRHEQPDVQLLDQQPPKAAQPSLQQQDPAVQLPGQQGQQKQGGELGVQPMLEAELPLQMRTRGAKRRRNSVLP
jgi:hypothetical protein